MSSSREDDFHRIVHVYNKTHRQLKFSLFLMVTRLSPVLYNYYSTGDNLITNIKDKNLTSGTGDMTSQALMEWYISDLKKKPQEKSMKVLCNIINGNNNIYGYMCVNNQKVKMTVMKFHFIIYITWFKSVWYKFWCVKLKSIFLIYDIINMVAPLFITHTVKISHLWHWQGEGRPKIVRQ